MPSSRFVQVVFGLLVIATAAAFFVAQALKRAPAVVERVSYPRFVSPNGDGRHDRAPFRFVLRERQRVTVSVVDEEGTPVRRLVEGRLLPQGRTVVVWDGRTNTGRVARDGRYRLRVELPAQGRAVTAGRLLTVDTRPPRPRLLSVRPTLVVPRPPAPRAPVRIRFRGPAHAPPLVRVFRTDRGSPRLVESFRGQRRRRVAVWAPRGRAARAPEGTYAFTVTVRDRAGNAGTAPARVSRRATARPGTGVTVDALSLAGPLEPVAPGAFARLAIAPRPAAVRWRLQRLGAPRALARGRGGGAGVIVRVPGRARTGVHLVHVTGAGGRAAHPLVVRRAGARSRRLPLVVVPAIAWAGRNPVDDDRDGFPDTLDTGSPVALARPFLHRAPGLDGAAPILRLLDDARVRYDITTDLALARGVGARLAGRPALVFPGDERWLPAPLLERLRGYVRAGGELVSFGADAFRRRVVVTPDRLEQPTPPAPADAFGERLAAARTDATPMTVFEDALGVLAPAAGGAFGRFTRIEVSLGLEPRARRLATAGLDADRPAFIAYRLGAGTVVRVGSPQWGSAARSRADVAQITRSLLRRAAP